MPECEYAIFNSSLNGHNLVNEGDEAVVTFHDRGFDDSTQLKLAIFRGYVREWLPVFMTRKRSEGRASKVVTICDFFSGPGKDAEGNPGSPLIIVDEVREFCRTRGRQKNENISVRMVFNDKDSRHVTQLQAAIDEIACPNSCCRFEFLSKTFEEALDLKYRELCDPDSANLVIMDQFGIKEVTPDVMKRLSQCSKTDILFFISSSYVRRFIDLPEIQKHFDLDKDDIKYREHRLIHRDICRYFRSRLDGPTLYLAPFSIKKGGNIYGVIFGSKSLLGLDKFLTVCWKLDKVTGEANYNIDGDFSWSGQMGLFSEDNTVTKVRLFEHELESFVADSSPDNRQVYEFCLLHGFVPSKANEVLKSMQKDGRIEVTDVSTHARARANAFYLSWDNYQVEPRARFSVGSKS